MGIVVITGASSGIGLVTARAVAKRGAKLVLAARDEDALRQLVEEIRGNGGRAIYEENSRSVGWATLELSLKLIHDRSDQEG